MVDTKEDLNDKKERPQEEQKEEQSKEQDIKESEEMKNYYLGLDYIPYP